MKSLIAAICLLLSLAEAMAQSTGGNSQLRSRVEALFDPRFDLARVKLTIDNMVDPAISIEAGMAVIDRMAAEIKTSAPEGSGSAGRLAALRRYVYEYGAWNAKVPFQYDLTDPLGDKPANRKLTRYLETRRGNCITMPILFASLGERIGLTMTLAEAPLHLFVKYTDDEGRSWNLETTSGAGFTRDDWYRQKLPMTEKAVQNGIYLRALSRNETVALIASFLVEHYLSIGEYDKAIAVADVLLQRYPNSAYLLAKKGTAYYRLLQSEVIGKYSRTEDVPPDTRVRADNWYAKNQQIFQRLDALGWRPEDGQAR
jgi:regulator of sirC expression with transglutaminase-like and TPR domain